jgi:hypothetical protein
MAQNHYLKKAVPHTLKIDNLHWYKDFFSLLGKMLGKNDANMDKPCKNSRN